MEELVSSLRGEADDLAVLIADNALLIIEVHSEAACRQCGYGEEVGSEVRDVLHILESAIDMGTVRNGDFGADITPSSEGYSASIT
jgi:hypothetical protein